MNYRHAFHAGNFADVTKHLALVSVLGYLARKESAFVVIDTHAGCGLYDLKSEEASRTAEAENGIGALVDLHAGSETLMAYLDLVRAAGAHHYPGSPLIAARMLRPQDRLVAIEKHPDGAAELARVLAPFRKARADCANGYARLAALLPPHERRGIILIDPPYEAPDEFETAAQAFQTGYRRFATGIYLLWFPIKSQSEADRFCGAVLATGASKVLRFDTVLDGAKDTRLNAAGLLVVNPPYKFEADMKSALADAAPRIGRDGKGASVRFEWLAGGE